MMNTDKNALKAKHSLMARLAGFFGRGRARSLNRPEQRNSPRRSEAGNVFFTLFGAVAVVGVLGAGIMSTMRGPLTTMVEVNRIEETKAQMRLNARLILVDAVDGASAPYCGAADDDTASSGSLEFVEPAGFTNSVTLPGPVGEGGGMPSIGGTQSDPWGQTYGYCAYNKGADNSATCGTENYISGDSNTNSPVIALISSGPDRVFQTSCAQAANNDRQGDDIIEPMTYNEAVSGSGGLWTATSASDAAINRNLDIDGAVDISGATNFQTDTTFGGNLSLTTVGARANVDVLEAVNSGTVIEINDSLDVNVDLNVDGNITGGTDNTVDINDGLSVSGNLEVTGTSTLAETTVTTLGATGAVDFDTTLNVDGNITGGTDNLVSIDDGLNVTGNADVDGDLVVNGGILNDTGTDPVSISDVEGLSVTGPTTLESTLTVNSDGDTNATNAITVNNGATTPVEIMTLNDAGTMTLTGTDLTTGPPAATVLSIAGPTIDGSTDLIQLYDGDTTPVEVFAVDTDGNTTIGGTLDVTGNITGTLTGGSAGQVLISNGTVFSPATISSDATLASDGTLTINDNAVQEDDIDASSFTTGTGSTCLKTDGSSIFTEACSGGGGGDGVGTDGFVDLADTPADYTGATAGDLVVVNSTTNGLEFSAVSSVVPDSDRIQDSTTPTADTYIDVDTTDDGLTNSIVFVNNGTQSMNITSAGVVTVDGGILNLGVSNTNLGRLRLYDSGTANSALIQNLNQALTINPNNNGTIVLETGSGTPVMIVGGNSNPNVAGATGQFSVGLADPTTINASAQFQIDSTTRGFLAPRMTTLERDAIASPATGLLVFTTDAGDAGLLQFWDGTAWVDVGGGGAAGGGLWTPDGTNDYIEYDDTLGGVRIGRVTGQPAPAIDWNFDVANSVVYTTTNTVAIGSNTVSNDGGSNTDVVLDLAGDIAAIEYCDADGANCFTPADVSAAANSNTDRIEDTGDQNTYIDVDTANDDSLNTIVAHTAGTQRLIIDANGDVGIGTMADPVSLLHAQRDQDAQSVIAVANANADTNSSALFLAQSDAGALTLGMSSTAGGAIAAVASDTAGGLTLQSEHASTSSISLNTGSTASSRVFIDHNGLVGINTASPQTRLDVAGTIRIGDGSELCNVAGHEGAIRYVAASDAYEVCANSATGWEPLFTGGSGAAGLWTDLGGDRIHFGTTGTEQVGIGTNNPVTTLDVNGGIRVGSASGAAPDYLSMDGLSDVDAASPADGQILQYNNASGNWELSTMASAAASLALNDVSDVSVASPNDGDLLSYDNATGNWVAIASASSADTLSDLSCNADELVRWNGSAWVCSAETDVDGTFDLQFTATAVSGGSWSSTGSTSALGGDTLFYTLGIALLDSTTMAVAYSDGVVNTILTTFTLSGGTWTEVGGAALDFGDTRTTLNMDAIANDSIMLSVGNGASGGVYAYRWDGSTWSLSDTAPNSDYGVAVALDNNTIAHYNNTDNTIYTYNWDGNAFTELGSSNSGLTESIYNMDQLDDNTVVFIEPGTGLTDQLRVYDWNGSTWTQVGSGYTLPIEAGGYGRTFIANSSNIVSIGESSTLYMYSWNGSTWAPSGSSAAAEASRGKMTMLDSDSAWHLGGGDVIQQYDFSATVAASQIVDTNATGQLDVLLNNGDRFLVSRTASNNQVFTVTNIPDANTLHVAELAATEGPVTADITILEDIPTALDDLSDVNVSFANDGQCLIYNNTSGNWEAGNCDPDGNTAEWTDDGSGNIYNTDGGAVGIGTGATPNQYSILEITSTTEGVLLPRLTTTERDDMDNSYGAGEEGMTIYNETDNTYQFWDGAAWQSFATSAGSANILQDADPDTSINVDTAGDGTANTIVFTNNSAETVRITSAGDVGIGTTTPAAKLDVTGDVRVSNYVRFTGVAGNAPTYTAPSLALNALTDVSAATPSTNDVLSWNGTNWVSSAPSGGGGAIDDLSDAATDYTTDYNMFMGDDAGASIASGGQYNLGIGQNAGDSITTGDENIAIGYDALSTIDEQSDIVAVGAGAGRLFDGPPAAIGSTFIGANAGEETGFWSNGGITAVGANALRHPGNTHAVSGTTVVGASALENAGQSETATDNTAMGAVAGIYFRGGRDNVYLGANVAQGAGPPYNHTGDGNVFIGSGAAEYLAGANNNNVIIGQAAGATLDSGDGNILIGQGVDVSSATSDNELNIGNTIYGDLSGDRIGIGAMPATGVELDVTGDIQYTGTLTDVSDRRLKENIKPLEEYGGLLEKIDSIDTYTFTMKDDEKGKIEFGVMAQELEEIFPELVNTAEDEMGTKSVNYVGLIAPMIEATKALKSENDALKAEIAEIRSAQADILEEVKGLSRHTGYGFEKASAAMLLALLMLMLGGGMVMVVRRKESGSISK